MQCLVGLPYSPLRFRKLSPDLWLQNIRLNSRVQNVDGPFESSEAVELSRVFHPKRTIFGPLSDSGFERFERLFWLAQLLDLDQGNGAYATTPW